MKTYKFKKINIRLYRVYFQKENRIYCLLGIGKMELYRCTNDGDPLFVHREKVKSYIEIPTGNDAREDKIIKDCIFSITEFLSHQLSIKRI